MTVEQIRDVFVDAFRRFGEDRAPNVAASLTFFAMLSISPVLVLAVTVTSIVLGEESARRSLLEQVESYIGRQGAEFIETLLENQALNQNGIWPTILGLGVIIFGASALFQHLREAVLIIWGDKPPRAGFMQMVVQRLIAGVMVPVFGIIMLAWLALEGFIAYWAPFEEGSRWGTLLAAFVSIAFFTVVAAAWIKYLVPTRLRWKDLIPGGLLVGVSFTLGKFVLTLYFALAKVSAAYGSAGAIVVLLVWIYYNVQIFFLGIEFTQSLLLHSKALHPARERKIEEKDKRRQEELPA